MKRIFRYILLALMVAVVAAPAYGASKKGSKAKSGKGKAKTEAAAPAPAPKKSKYDKFVSAKGTVRYPGIVDLYQDKSGKIWAEIPDSLLGRDFLFDQITKANGDPTAIDGRNISNNVIYRIERRDSVIVFSTSESEVHPEDAADAGVRAAIEQSTTRRTVYSFPVKCAKKDSSAYIFNISKVFTPTSENTNLEGLTMGQLNVIKGKFDPSKSGKPTPVTFNNSFGVKREASFDCTCSYAIFVMDNTYPFSSMIQSTLTLLPVTDLSASKKADTRIGTYDVKRTVFSTTGKNENLKLACKWDLSGDKQIKVYVDTLFSPVMYKAICQGIEAWNVAFERAGLGKKIITIPFYKRLNADDPLTTSVKYCGGMGASIRGKMQTDDNANILAFQICVPGYVCNYARRYATLRIGDVDSRFGFQEQQDEKAIAEIVRAQIMKAVGNGLGLNANMAGSRAYTPEQLRDPGFTRKNGITASVTDDAIFNIMARPGDKERGVLVINDKIGEYDCYAIDWLYADGQIDDKPEHLFVGSSKTFRDPRGIKSDLGNDIVASYEAGISHVRNSIAPCREYMETLGSGESESDALIIDYLFLEHWNYMASLAAQVGAYGANEMRQNGTSPKYEAVPAPVQKKCTELMLKLVEETEYLSSDKEFFRYFGPSRNSSEYAIMNVSGMIMVATRLPKILFACDVAGSEFTGREFMDMVSDSMFKNVRAGKLDVMEDNKISGYIKALTSMSVVLANNFNETMSGHKLSFAEPEFTDEYKAATGRIPAKYVDEAELIAYQYLQKSAEILKLARCKFTDEAQRSKIDYLIYEADAALGKYNKK